MFKHTLMSLAALTASGCAAIQIPPERLEQNEASMRGAEELGASGVPAARLHLQLAKEQTEKAKQLAAAGDERATRMLDRAHADAELAIAMAREASVHADAQKAAAALKAVESRDAP
jgi:hypothetical protein